MRTQTKIFLIFVSVIFLIFKSRPKDNICEFSNLSIQSVKNDTEVIALVLTRWQAYENRQVMRKMFATVNTIHVFKPIFLMGIDRIPKEVLFKSRDRLGVKRAKPLWTEVMELLGGKYKDIRDQLYGDQS